MTENKHLTYLAGDIMTPGSRLRRQEEVDRTMEKRLPLVIYSPVLNKSINDKTGVSISKNNHLAEAITAADIERMWNSEIVVMEPLPSAIGTVCELGCIFGWKYLAEQYDKCNAEKEKDALIQKMKDKALFVHYEDLRDTDIPEKGWRRSHSINQLLYGMILYSEFTGDIETFDEILDNIEDITENGLEAAKKRAYQERANKQHEEDNLSEITEVFWDIARKVDKKDDNSVIDLINELKRIDKELEEDTDE